MNQNNKNNYDSKLKSLKASRVIIIIGIVLQCIMSIVAICLCGFALIWTTVFPLLLWFGYKYNESKIRELEEVDPNKYNQDIAEMKQAEIQRQREFLQKRKDLMEKGIVSCPRCGSTAITSVKQGPYADTFAEGYSWAREISGGCTVLNVCQNCNHRFYPGV